MGACGGQSGTVTVLSGVCGGQSGTVTGLYRGSWWVEWHCNSFMWGLVVDRVAV